MVIYNSGFLILDYDPTTDILTVSFPPVDDILFPEISRSFGLIVEHARNYDIKKVLIDARNTQVDLQEVEFAVVIEEFVRYLSTTRVEKIARLSSPSFFRENLVEKVFMENHSHIQFQSFNDSEVAIEWLKG
ncbi:hypothetical protein [Rufibacter latericius]|uniref:STAS/SEC14 domain-containing protein n=1 Tax=Rufibacter latericius TaxID=2487040 RepID=A0A3M9MVC7_9BACT|nr:hypothetical protein [Rufibacter latericius]RNI29087.1 hypothetical protein EFB08_06555 [Rufibacter latericius]